MERYVFSVEDVTDEARVEFFILANNLVDAISYAALLNPSARFERTSLSTSTPDLRDMFD